MKRPLLKYCGNKNREDYRLSSRSEADCIGFIFAESKRRTEPSEVKEWMDEFGKNGKKHVGVFVNPTLGEVEEACRILNLDAVQFHGEEPLSLLEEFKQRNGQEIWKAIRHGESALRKMAHYGPAADVFLIDSSVKGSWGGTGVSFDWSLAGSYIKQAEQMGKPCFIAGGVSPDNVIDLLKIDPAGIDLASGVERNGIKDERLLKNFEKRVFDYVSGH
ncbi:phosphoribosylanthranilate isomerase [Metabacillus sp. KIGAM252]|uniref:N-(5'-phosphoribosyl)anthranilate isomerase n=1 Tax=Metabacillus flavus TaxID=2823519 RepID=A0ABS5LFM9_9BACI|nr:phosphoribosylanthranilate isomerase [Metabacillus flavus]MBS2969404.1 phosphoribosylanthranilate isomerase [Metabacillus flavus]